MATLPEFADLLQLAEAGRPWLNTLELGAVTVAGEKLPLLAFTLGNPDPTRPGLGLFGGVHGLERIGAEVVTAYLRSLVRRLPWDSALHQQLEGLRLVIFPRVNPGGLLLGTRANPQGIDLMRNAPVEAPEAPWPLGGQRLSARLPWYRGPRHAGLAPEAAALCRLVEQELHPRPFSLALDCHSGFGMRDRLWFPYAHAPEPIPHLAEVHALASIFRDSHPHHQYVFEPQSRQYLTHGDLWDHLYLRAVRCPERVFIPLTLEMGSWLWVKKNPRQLLTRLGIFNPLVNHRQHRVLRRHLALFDFLAHAAHGHARWRPEGPARDRHFAQALALWYAPAA